MRTVNISELRKQLSNYLQYVKNLGALKMPEEEIDWGEFFLAPAGHVSRKAAVTAVIESRGDR